MPFRLSLGKFLSHNLFLKSQMTESHNIPFYFSGSHQICVFCFCTLLFFLYILFGQNTIKAKTPNFDLFHYFLILLCCWPKQQKHLCLNEGTLTLLIQYFFWFLFTKVKKYITESQTKGFELLTYSIFAFCEFHLLLLAFL